MHNDQKTATRTDGLAINHEMCLKLCKELDIDKHVEVNGDWFNGAIRHIVRNVEPDCFMGDDVLGSGWIPGKYDGCVLAEMLQTVIDTAYPQEISKR